jgi:hypothetical protein
MASCDTRWLRSFSGAIRHYRSGGRATIDSPRSVHCRRNISSATQTLALHVCGGALERDPALDEAAGALRSGSRIAVSDTPCE